MTHGPNVKDALEHFLQRCAKTMIRHQDRWRRQQTDVKSNLIGNHLIRTLLAGKRSLSPVILFPLNELIFFQSGSFMKRLLLMAINKFKLIQYTRNRMSSPFSVLTWHVNLMENTGKPESTNLNDSLLEEGDEGAHPRNVNVDLPKSILMGLFVSRAIILFNKVPVLFALPLQRRASLIYDDRYVTLRKIKSIHLDRVVLWKTSRSFPCLLIYRWNTIQFKELDENLLFLFQDWFPTFEFISQYFCIISR